MFCFAEYRKWGIHTHGCDRFTAIFCHRQDALLQLIIRITECFLHTLSFFIGKFRNTLIRDL